MRSGHPMDTDVPVIPQHVDEPELTRLINARHAAVDAVLVADDLEHDARNARRKATSLLKAYERLLEEHNGQLRLEGIDDEGALRG